MIKGVSRAGAPVADGPARIVQLYDVVRTAHLERAAELGDVTILYKSRRYDFDDAIASKVKAKRAGLLGAGWFALTHTIDVLEVNEPLMESAAPRSAVVIAAARLRSALLRRPRTQVVAYAIANLAPRELVPNLPWKARIRFHLQWLFVDPVWRGVDRLALGTEDAANLYRAEFASRRSQPVCRQLESLPAPAAGLPAVRDRTIVFLGDMSERKGFPQVLVAWEVLRAHDANARLLLIGRGQGATAAATLAERDARVQFVHDPPREQIFPLLARSRVLVLPSRRRPLWKEQIGLPILEGLAHGCIIVTTTESGISNWLHAHGHVVLPEDARADELAEALVRALDSDKTPLEVLADLPDVDGREVARRWMYELLP